MRNKFNLLKYKLNLLKSKHMRLCNYIFQLSFGLVVGLEVGYGVGEGVPPKLPQGAVATSKRQVGASPTPPTVGETYPSIVAAIFSE